MGRRTHARRAAASPLGVLGSSGSSTLLRRYARHRSPADLDELVRRFHPLVRRLALRYVRGSEPVDDLEQVASLGLVKAINRFDPEKGFAFTSFAVPTILGELKRSFRDTAWSAHVPRSVQERVFDVRRESDAFASTHGRSPSVGELAAVLDRDEEEVVEALDAAGAMHPVSLNGPRGGEDDDDDDEVLMDRLGDGDSGYELVEDRVAIEAALSALTGPQRDVLRLRFEEDLKQTEIAQRVGCSQMQVSRLMRSGLQRLSAVANHHSTV
jgi:RNA polymerase sigma-B factor